MPKRQDYILTNKKTNSPEQTTRNLKDNLPTWTRRLLPSALSAPSLWPIGPIRPFSFLASASVHYSSVASSSHWHMPKNGINTTQPRSSQEGTQKARSRRSSRNSRTTSEVLGSLPYSTTKLTRACQTFKKALEGGHDFEPPRLILAINQGGHFSLTEAVTKKPPHKID